MTRVVTIDEARALLAAEVTTTCDECRDKATGVCLACHLPLCGRHREHANNFGVRCGGVIGPTADDLAASLIAQTAENERLTALAAARDDRIGDLCDEAGLLREEIDEAHATIERQSVVGGIASKEIARLRAEVAVWRERPDGAQMQHALDVARAEVLALRSIVDGRTVPPTPNEVEAHRATGGSWRWSVISRGLAMAGMGGTSQTPHGSAIPAGWRRDDHITECWWALDREDRPCAWPVAP